MRKWAKILMFSGLLLLVGVLFGFAKKRNAKRILSDVKIEFIDCNTPFITHETVNKLLIQSTDSLTDITLETLDLMGMEERLNSNSMIRNSEVFLTPQGVLGVRIEQRDPVGRILHPKADYYVDADGKPMPLSEVYAARVPLISGVSVEDLEALVPLLIKIRADQFMQQAVIGLHKNNKGDFELYFRNIDLKAIFGKGDDIDLKFRNFKAFYKKTKQDSTIYAYDQINLKFGSQVIATKK